MTYTIHRNGQGFWVVETPNQVICYCHEKYFALLVKRALETITDEDQLAVSGEYLWEPYLGEKGKYLR